MAVSDLWPSIWVLDSLTAANISVYLRPLKIISCFPYMSPKLEAGLSPLFLWWYHKCCICMSPICNMTTFSWQHGELAIERGNFWPVLFKNTAAVENFNLVSYLYCLSCTVVYRLFLTCWPVEGWGGWGLVPLWSLSIQDLPCYRVVGAATPIESLGGMRVDSVLNFVLAKLFNS